MAEVELNLAQRTYLALLRDRDTLVNQLREVETAIANVERLGNMVPTTERVTVINGTALEEWAKTPIEGLDDVLREAEDAAIVRFEDRDLMVEDFQHPDDCLCGHPSNEDFVPDKARGFEQGDWSPPKGGRALPNAVFEEEGL